MTAYAQKAIQLKKMHLTLEVLSLNKKNLDIHLHIPKEFFRLEIAIRKKIAEVVGRGVITLKIVPTFSEETDLLLPEDKTCKAMKSALEKKRDLLNLDDPITLSFILDQCGQYVKPQMSGLSEEEEPLLMKKISEVLHDWVHMKQVEGTALGKDIKEKLENITTKLTIIEKLSPLSIDRYRERLKEKIEALVKDITLEEERIAKEILYFADKVDVNEEIIRFKSHISQFISSLETKEISIGRTLDFLLQEMGREINSLGVKSQELEISKLVIEIKSDLEKIREQVQNIE